MKNILTNVIAGRNCIDNHSLLSFIREKKLVVADGAQTLTAALAQMIRETTDPCQALEAAFCWLEQPQLDTQAVLQLAEDFLSKDWLREASSLLEAALNRQAESPYLRVALGKIRRKEGRNPEALDLIRSAFDKAPENTGIALELQWTLLDAKQFQEACRAAQSYLAHSKMSPHFFGAILRLYTEMVLSYDAAYSAEFTDELRTTIQLNLGLLGDSHAPFLPGLLKALQKADQIRLAVNVLLQATTGFNDRRKSLKALCVGVADEVNYWPLVTLFDADWLGDVQLSAQLSIIGRAAWAARDPFRAASFLISASILDPANEKHKFNIGTLLLSLGEIPLALDAFRGAKRFYNEKIPEVIWPIFHGVEWPNKPFPWSNSFQSLLPPGQDWPTISIVTPSLNQGKFIEETILSVINQAYPHLEYIVVDGMSTDETLQIIERYKGSISRVIVETDDGQTEAINKGLRLCKGEIITWLNSDDMLTPGALFVSALLFLHTTAEIIAGMCVEHDSHRILMGSKPTATQHNFTPSCLADIFGRWLKGDYFYQPEVMFRRSAFDLIGGRLDESLHFTMDYDLWMRFSQRGSRIETTHFPLAYFRKHPEQKTSDLLPCLEEQAAVRDRYFDIPISFERSMQLKSKFLFLRSESAPNRILVISSRIKKIFSSQMAEDLAHLSGPGGAKYEFKESTNGVDLHFYSAVVFLIHLQDEILQLLSLKEHLFRGPVLGWFWDNHHHPLANAEVAELMDIVVPGHSYPSSYLRNNKSILAESVPLCLTQWSIAQLKSYFGKYSGSLRSNALFGGFVKYAFASRRNDFLHSVMSAIAENELYFLSECNLSRYFSKSEEERFAYWSSYKCSLIVPLNGDLSQRFFDALACGLVPIVPHDLRDLNIIVSAEERRSLPIITYDARDVSSVINAHRAAVTAFDNEGFAGMLARHQFATKKHSFEARIHLLTDFLFNYDPV